MQESSCGFFCFKFLMDTQKAQRNLAGGRLDKTTKKRTISLTFHIKVKFSLAS